MHNKNLFKLRFKSHTAGATEATLKKFESDTKKKIPDEYRLFLKSFNGGAPRERNISFGQKPYQDTVLRAFFGVDCKPSYELKIVLKQYSSRIPEGYFPIADDQFGNLVLISQHRDSCNQIFFWDHETELTNGALAYISSCLLDFINMLKADDLTEYAMITFTFVDGESFRIALPAKLNSIDQNSVIDATHAKIGERINDFGVVRRISNIEISNVKSVS